MRGREIRGQGGWEEGEEEGSLILRGRGCWRWLNVAQERVPSDRPGEAIFLCHCLLCVCGENVFKCRHFPLTAAEETRLTQRARLVTRPSLPATRKLLSRHYSLPPSPEGRSLSPRSKFGGKVHTGGTVPHLATLPWQQRNTLVVCVIFGAYY